jgi:hypothetical protein
MQICYHTAESLKIEETQHRVPAQPASSYVVVVAVNCAGCTTGPLQRLRAHPQPLCALLVRDEHLQLCMQVFHQTAKSLKSERMQCCVCARPGSPPTSSAAQCTMVPYSGCSRPSNICPEPHPLSATMQSSSCTQEISQPMHADLLPYDQIFEDRGDAALRARAARICLRRRLRGVHDGPLR